MERTQSDFMHPRHWVRILACSLMITFAGFAPADLMAAGNGISSPTEGERVFGTITIRGIADAPDFLAWQLDVLLNGNPEAPIQLGKNKKAISEDGAFTKLDTRTLPDGPHKLRLRVIKISGQYEEFFVNFTVDNANPPRTPTKVAAKLPTALNQISRPPDGAVVSGVVTVTGFADSPDFQSWKLDLLFDGKDTNALTIAASRTRHPNGEDMTQLDTTVFPNGRHLLRLRVSNKDGTFTESTSVLFFENKKPEPKNLKQKCPKNAFDALPAITQNILWALLGNFFSQINSPCPPANVAP